MTVQACPRGDPAGLLAGWSALVDSLPDATWVVDAGSLCVVVGPAPVRYSMTAVSDSSPLADEKAAAAIPSISTMKLKTV